MPASTATRDWSGATTRSPDYATEVEGLRLSGVIEGEPAAAAGLAAGDVIVEVRCGDGTHRGATTR
jgi:S1-C subfamily serine protease